MNENDQLLEQAAGARRRFIAAGVRNVLAIGAIAASAAVAKLTPASAVTRGLRPVPGGGGRSNCFLKGTKIQTVQGERKVEDLAIGDLLPTVFGGVRPIQWVGRYRYRKSDPRKPWARAARPARIVRSALAPNVPHADLYVTPSHALFIDGLLVSVDRLVNGLTIALYDADEYDELEFFHLKLETHDVIHAEGAACETLTNVCENASNFAEYLRLYGANGTTNRQCAPAVRGPRGELNTRLRNLMSPWREPEKLDIVRDRLEDRAILLRERMEE
jgi:hypothetical protein